MNLLEQIRSAMDGETRTIPFRHPKLNKNIFLGKRLYHFIGGAGGSGKSAWVDLNYVINPILWYRKYGQEKDIKIHIVLRSMERTAELRRAKWVCMKLYLDHKILIDTSSLLGWGEEKSRVPESMYGKITEAYEWACGLEEHVELIDGAENPTGIYNHLIKLALSKGTLYRYEKNDKGQQVLYKYRGEDKTAVPAGECDEATPYQAKYFPDDPTEVIWFIVDHLQALKNERNYNDKQNLDKLSEYCRILRDLFGMSPIIINQLNRGVGDTYRRVKTTLMPEDGDFAGSSNMYYDCDMAAILFHPYKYDLNLMAGWKVKSLNAEDGFNRFRSFHILKNTYGPDNQILGYQFIGENGLFGELPHPNKCGTGLYESAANPEFEIKITKHGTTI